VFPSEGGTDGNGYRVTKTLNGTRHTRFAGLVCSNPPMGVIRGATPVFLIRASKTKSQPQLSLEIGDGHDGAKLPLLAPESGRWGNPAVSSLLYEPLKETPHGVLQVVWRGGWPG